MHVLAKTVKCSGEQNAAEAFNLSKGRILSTPASRDTHMAAVGGNSFLLAYSSEL